MSASWHLPQTTFFSCRATHTSAHADSHARHRIKFPKPQFSWSPRKAWGCRARSSFSLKECDRPVWWVVYVWWLVLQCSATTHKWTYSHGAEKRTKQRSGWEHTWAEKEFDIKHTRTCTHTNYVTVMEKALAAHTNSATETLERRLKEYIWDRLWWVRLWGWGEGGGMKAWNKDGRRRKCLAVIETNVNSMHDTHAILLHMEAQPAAQTPISTSIYVSI